MLATVCGAAASLALTALIVWWAVSIAVLRGDDRIYLLNPLVVFVTTGLVWAVLAVIAVVLGARTRRRGAVLLGSIALVEVAAGVGLAFVS